MDQFWTLALAVPIGIIVLCAGLLAAWRRIPRPEPTPDIQTLWSEVQANRLAIADLVDKYETSAQRARGRGRKKRYDDEEEAPAAPPPPSPAATLTKSELRARAREVYPQLVR